ncbi:CorA family divalent cation transporter [Streptomyces erythrochromogenes]|uniref:CorA family divalent cation transporter n=1 Tax=Streptomyces erythrochromogenes TaxID=285574 RepID=UPI00225972D4|nr:CorA family divalent cation transporter [Streptomyces erythrochromogenes]MCX5589218.1 CorA family divalent cation transporter [Streptomyces erythrochromogenes]
MLRDIESLHEASRRTFLTGFFGMNFAYLTDEIESGAVFWLLAVGLQVAFLAVALVSRH